MFFDKVDPYTDRLIAIINRVPLPIHRTYKRQYDAKTGRLFPTTHGPYDNSRSTPTPAHLPVRHRAFAAARSWNRSKWWFLANRRRNGTGVRRHTRHRNCRDAKAALAAETILYSLSDDCHQMVWGQPQRGAASVCVQGVGWVAGFKSNRLDDSL